RSGRRDSSSPGSARGSPGQRRRGGGSGLSRGISTHRLDQVRFRLLEVQPGRDRGRARLQEAIALREGIGEAGVALRIRALDELLGRDRGGKHLVLVSAPRRDRGGTTRGG